MKCDCSDWKLNIDKVNAPLILQVARSGFQTAGYDGVPFKYCPWCSKPLELEVNEVVSGSLQSYPA